MHKLYKKGVDGHNSVPTANRQTGQRNANAPITRYSLPLRHFGPRIPTCTERTTAAQCQWHSRSAVLHCTGD